MKEYDYWNAVTWKSMIIEMQWHERVSLLKDSDQIDFSQRAFETSGNITQILCITSQKTSMFRPVLFLRSTPVQYMTHGRSTSRALSHTEAENDTIRCLATKWGEVRRKVLVAFKAWLLWRPREINGAYRWAHAASGCANLNCFNNSAERTYIVNRMGLRWWCVECHVQRWKYQKYITKLLTFQSPMVAICINTFNIHKFYVLPTQCIFVFCVDLRTNTSYLPM